MKGGGRREDDGGRREEGGVRRVEGERIYRRARERCEERKSLF